MKLSGSVVVATLLVLCSCASTGPDPYVESIARDARLRCALTWGSAPTITDLETSWTPPGSGSEGFVYRDGTIRLDVDPDAGAIRIRFLVAHELAHLWIRDRGYRWTVVEEEGRADRMALEVVPEIRAERFASYERAIAEVGADEDRARRVLASRTEDVAKLLPVEHLYLAAVGYGRTEPR